MRESSPRLALPHPSFRAPHFFAPLSADYKKKRGLLVIYLQVANLKSTIYFQNPNDRH